MTSESLPLALVPVALVDPVAPMVVLAELPLSALVPVGLFEITPLVPAVVPVALLVPNVAEAAGAVGLFTVALAPVLVCVLLWTLVAESIAPGRCSRTFSLAIGLPGTAGTAGTPGATDGTAGVAEFRVCGAPIGLLICAGALKRAFAPVSMPASAAPDATGPAACAARPVAVKAIIRAERSVLSFVM